MKVLTIIKQVPDAESNVQVLDGAVEVVGGAMVIDGMDEYGVEESIRQREAGQVDEVIVAALGPASCEEALRTALAMGADRGVHVITTERLDALAQAQVFAELVSREGAGLVLLGGKQADWDSAALGPALAAVLDWPHADWVSELRLADGKMTARHDTDQGTEVLNLVLPAVVTTQQGLNEPRYPTLPNTMKAKRKELSRLSLDDFPSVQVGTEVVGLEVQVAARRGVRLSGAADEMAEELVRLLREEAKVL